ncbi:MAG: hypothetical protein FJ276_36885 [Planctomycetes bacterium]|nr:hypothetical protein [Planctomycetota bacterium]
MKWSDFEKYLKGEHLQGRKPTVTIEKITLEECYAASGRPEQKPVAYFQGSKKGLILSPTNMRALHALFGDNVAACIGKRVQLEAVPMRVAGRDTLPVRINPAPPAPTSTPQARPAETPANPTSTAGQEE